MALGKTCESCGMLMIDIADFAAKNRYARHCRYCTNAEGMLQSVQERLTRFTKFLMEEEGLSEEAAKEAAIARMRKMPAWKGKV